MGAPDTRHTIQPIHGRLTSVEMEWELSGGGGEGEAAKARLREPHIVRRQHEALPLGPLPGPDAPHETT